MIDNQRRTTLPRSCLLFVTLFALFLLAPCHLAAAPHLKRCEPANAPWASKIPWGDEGKTINDCPLLSWGDLTPQQVEAMTDAILLSCDEKVFGNKAYDLMEFRNPFVKNLKAQKAKSVSEVRDGAKSAFDAMMKVVEELAEHGRPLKLLLEIPKAMTECIAFGMIDGIPGGVEDLDKPAMKEGLEAILKTISAPATALFDLADNSADLYRAVTGKLEKDYKRTIFAKLLHENRWVVRYKANKAVEGFDQYIAECRVDDPQINVLKDKAQDHYLRSIQEGRKAEGLAAHTIQCLEPKKDDPTYKEVYDKAVRILNEANAANCAMEGEMQAFQGKLAALEKRRADRAAAEKLRTDYEAAMGEAAKNCDQAGVNKNRDLLMNLVTTEACLYDYDAKYANDFASRLMKPDPDAKARARTLIANVKAANLQCEMYAASQSVSDMIAELRKMSGYQEWKCIDDLKPTVIDPLQSDYDENKADHDLYKAAFNGIRSLLDSVKQSCDFESAKQALTKAEDTLAGGELSERCLRKLGPERRLTNQLERVRGDIDSLEAEVLVALANHFNRMRVKLIALREQFGSIGGEEDSGRCDTLHSFINGFPTSFFEPVLSTGDTGVPAALCKPLDGVDAFTDEAESLLQQAKLALNDDFGFERRIAQVEQAIANCLPTEELQSLLAALSQPPGICKGDFQQRIEQVRNQAEQVGDGAEAFVEKVKLAFENAKSAFQNCDFGGIGDAPAPSGCETRAFTGEMNQRISQIEKFKSDAAEVESARSLLRSAIANAPTLLELCRPDGADTLLRFRNARRHANFLETFPEECINNSAEIQDYGAILREKEKVQQQYASQRRELRGKFNTARARIINHQERIAQNAEPFVLSKSETLAYDALRSLEEVRRLAEPKKCFEELLAEVNALDTSFEAPLVEVVQERAAPEREDPEPAEDDLDDYDPLADSDLENAANEIENIFDKRPDATTALARQRDRQEQALGRSRDRVSDRQRTAMASLPDYSRMRSDPDRYRDAIDRGRRQRGEGTFFEGRDQYGRPPLTPPSTGGGASQPGRTGASPGSGHGSRGPVGASPHLGVPQASEGWKCKDVCEDMMEKQKAMLAGQGATMSSDQQRLEKMSFNSCMRTCERGGVSSQVGSCVNSCMQNPNNHKRYKGVALAEYCDKRCVR